MEAVAVKLLEQVNTNTAKEMEEQELDWREKPSESVHYPRERVIVKKSVIMRDREFVLLSSFVL
jgi:hypothetical protein